MPAEINNFREDSASAVREGAAVKAAGKIVIEAATAGVSAARVNEMMVPKIGGALHTVELAAAKPELIGKTIDRVATVESLFNRENTTIYKTPGDGKDKTIVDLKPGEKLTAGDYLVVHNGSEFGMHLPKNKSGKPMPIAVELHGLLTKLPNGKGPLGTASSPEEFARDDLPLNGVSENTESIIITPHAPHHPIRKSDDPKKTDNPVYVWNVQPGLKHDEDYNRYLNEVGHNCTDLTIAAVEFARDTTNASTKDGRISGHSYGGLLALATAADPRSAGMFPNIDFVASTDPVDELGKSIITQLAPDNGRNIFIVRPRSAMASTILLDAQKGDAIAQKTQAASDLGRNLFSKVADSIKVKDKPANQFGAFLKSAQEGIKAIDPGLANLKLTYENGNPTHSPGELVNLAVSRLGVGVIFESSQYTGNTDVRTLADFPPGNKVDYSPAVHGPQIHERGNSDRLFILTSADGQRSVTVVNSPNGGHFVRDGKLRYYDDQNRAMKASFDVANAVETMIIRGKRLQAAEAISQNTSPMHPNGS